MLEFYSVASYEKWKKSLAPDAIRNWSVKYYKGLGTSTSDEGRTYFKALGKHRVAFAWGGDNDGERIELAFSKYKVPSCAAAGDLVWRRRSRL